MRDNKNIVAAALDFLGLPSLEDIPGPSDLARELGIPTPGEIIGNATSGLKGKLGQFRR